MFRATQTTPEAAHDALKQKSAISWDKSGNRLPSFVLYMPVLTIPCNHGTVKGKNTKKIFCSCNLGLSC
jgi:hypothetical protein